MNPVTVKVADGASLTSSDHVPVCHWRYGDMQFTTRFRLLALGHYDGILGLDWLASLGPMGVDWGQKWLTVSYKGKTVTFWGIPVTDI